MPVSLAHIVTDSRTITFTVRGETCTVAYTPGKVNDALLTRLDTDLATRNAALCDIIQSWDVYEDEAMTVPVALTPERLAELDVEFKSLLVRAIAGDMRPN